MFSEQPFIHNKARLDAAVRLLSGADTVADIGCDHGRLGVSLLQGGGANRVIAIDISAPSLEKARQLSIRTCVDSRMETRLGDGLMPLRTGEADAVAMLGMGGTLMKEKLSACPQPLCGAGLGVFQPMRGVADIRRYLFEAGYAIGTDLVVQEGTRYYQVFSALTPKVDSPSRQPLPPGWPEDCFFLGYTAFQNREKLLLPYARQLLSQRLDRLSRAEVPKLRREAAQLSAILEAF